MWFRAFSALTFCLGLLLWEVEASAQTNRGGYGKPRIIKQLHNVQQNQRRRGRALRRLANGRVTKADAVRSALQCSGGGEALNVHRQGNGFSVRVLNGSYVQVIFVDSNGNCS